MFRIKLLILLLVSVFFFSCTNTKKTNYKFALNYVGGNVNGLIYQNYLTAYLKSFEIYNPNSNFRITTSINHSSEAYITNVNKTSDREMITTSISAKVYDEINQCVVYSFSKTVEQYYVITSNINYTSNNKANTTIKENNSEILSKEFVYKLLNHGVFQCDEK